MKKMVATVFCVAAAGVLGACSGSAGASGSGSSTIRVSAVGASVPTATGSVGFQARVWVRTQAGDWVEVTHDAAAHAVVDASGRAGAVALATARVDTGTYVRVRVMFARVNARLGGSLRVGTGLLSGTVDVDTQGDGSITVERPVRVAASAGATTHLLIDLNSDVWLSQASVSTRTVSETAFSSAVRVTAR